MVPLSRIPKRPGPRIFVAALQIVPDDVVQLLETTGHSALYVVGKVLYGAMHHKWGRLVALTVARCRVILVRAGKAT
jgi:hypothetical protein